MGQMYQCTTGPRTVTQFQNDQCSNNCKCWKNAFGCNSNRQCFGDLICENNICLMPAMQTPFPTPSPTPFPTPSPTHLTSPKPTEKPTKHPSNEPPIFQTTYPSSVPLAHAVFNVTLTLTNTSVIDILEYEPQFNQIADLVGEAIHE